MKGCALAVALIVASSALVFASSYPVHAQSATKYEIQLASDGSANWIIEQTGTSLNSSLETLLAFRNQVSAIVEAAQNVTGREMSTPDDAISLTSAISGSYVTVKYTFLWTNFSSTSDHTLTTGDVFNVPNLFDELFGDGEVQLTYPFDCTIGSINPQPKEQDDSLHLIIWAGTMDFMPDGVTLVFAEKPTTSSSSAILGKYEIPIVGIAIAAIVGCSGLYVYKHRKKRQQKTKETFLPNHSTIETDEDKIQNLLRSSGGMMFQSAIVEECNFSKAKTSLLLATLEGRGVVARERRGRDKVVTLIQEGGEKRDGDLH